MKRTLSITLEPDWKQVLREAAQVAEASGASPEYGPAVERLNFETPEQFFSRLTPRRWEMIRSMQGAGELGVRELARRLGRDVRRVHDDVRVLEELRLVERTPSGRLLCPYDEIHVDMHLRAA